MVQTATTDKSARSLLLVAALAVAALAFVLARNLPLGIRGEWVWNTLSIEGRQPPVFLLSAFIAALVYLLVAAAATRTKWETLPRRTRALWLIIIVLAVFALQAALLNAQRLPWVSAGSIIASPNATTYYSTSLDIKDTRAWVGSYEHLMPTLPYHVRTHPPGLVLFFSLVRKLAAALVPADSPFFSQVAEAYRVFGIGPTPADAAAAIVSAFLIAFLGALAVIPVYLLAANLVLDRIALYAALLAGTLPALLLLGASPDLILLTLTATTLWLAYFAWRFARPGPAFLGGLAFALGTFLSLGLLVVVVWLALLVVIGALRRRDRAAAVRMFIPIGLAGLAGFALVYVVLALALHYHPFAVAQQALFAHRGVTTVEAARTFWKWVLTDPVEFAVFAGLSLVIAAVWSVVEVRPQEEFRCLRTFLLASLGAFVLLVLSGTVRGEVGRIWLFLMWPLALAAAPMFVKAGRTWPLLAIILLQLLQVLLMRSYLTLYSVL